MSLATIIVFQNLLLIGSEFRKMFNIKVVDRLKINPHEKSQLRLAIVAATRAAALARALHASVRS